MRIFVQNNFLFSKAFNRNDKAHKISKRCNFILREEIWVELAHDTKYYVVHDQKDDRFGMR